MPYIVDGNNLLGSLVFDGHPLRYEMAAQDLGPLRVRVPDAGRDADSVIREMVERSPRPSELIVVTSDKALYSYVKTLGAAVLRAHEWNALERKLARQKDAAAEKPDHEDDVEGWLERFGGGKRPE
jgi:predicted RNA-binding protein with PIN domain